MKRRLPFDALELTWFIDPKNGDDEKGDGSFANPVRTAKGLEQLFERIGQDHHKAEREKAEKKEREWTEKRLAEREKEDAERQTREAERKAKEKELDDKISQLEVELTSLEKTYIETTHLFEIAQLDMMSVLEIDERKIKHVEARAIATQLHHLRMALMARSAEHEMLVAQRGKKSSWESLLGGQFMWAAVGGMALWAYQLFAKSTEKKK